MFLKNYSQIFIKTKADLVFLFVIFVVFLFVFFVVFLFFLSSIVIEGARTLLSYVHIKETKTEKIKLLFIQINTNLLTFKDTKQSAKLF